MVPYLTVCIKSHCVTKVSWEHFLHSPWTTRVVFYGGQDFRKVFSYIWCEEISTSSPPFPLPPFHDHAFSVPGLISNMEEETCIVCSLCRGKKYKILNNISVFLRLFEAKLKFDLVEWPQNKSRLLFPCNPAACLCLHRRFSKFHPQKRWTLLADTFMLYSHFGFYLK